MKHPVINGFVVAATAAALIAGFEILPVLVAAVVCWAILRIGVMMLASMARPVPEPPPAGELRKVKIAYRCEICGSEVRMTIAPDEEPEPPRHCQEDMVLQTPVDI